jgi:nucleoside phosphorylase
MDWLRENLGMVRLPSVGRAAAGPADVEEDLTREIIDFDSESHDVHSDARAFFAAAPKAHGLSQFRSIPWPKGLAPRPAAPPAGDGLALPKCDVLVVTWTMDEGHALAKVLTPGFDSRDDWQRYTKNYAAIAATMQPLAPARHKGDEYLGTYWTATVGAKQVTLFKSASHMSQDGPQLANAVVWRQIIEDSQPDLVITCGTGGAIGAAEEVGDVIVSRYVTFDCKKKFPQFDGLTYHSPAWGRASYGTAKRLLAANAEFLPSTNTRPPRIITARSKRTGILTTDFFGFDTSDDHYELQGKGALAEMGDAVLGMVCEQMGASAPPYVAVRNVSDPQIAAQGTLRDQAAIAAAIYKGYGRWSSVCGSIVVWALIASL